MRGDSEKTSVVSSRLSTRTRWAALLLVLWFGLCAPGWAQIAFRSATSAGAPSGVPIALRGVGGVGFNQGAVSSVYGLSLPAGLQIGDLMLLVVEARSSTALSVPNGWSVLLNATSGSTNRAAVFYRVATASETVPSVTNGGSNSILARIVAFSGVDPNSPIDASSMTNSGADDTTEAAAVTTSTPNAMLVFTTHVANDFSSASLPGSAWTQGFLNYSTSGSDTGIAAQYALQSTAGSSGALTSTRSKSGQAFGGLIALRPMVSGTLNLAVPAGTAAGDVMVANVSVRPHTTPIVPPGGWTLLRETVQSQGAPESVRMATYISVADASEPAAYAWNFGASHSGATGAVASFSGVDSQTPVDVESGNTTASGIVQQVDGINTTLAGTMLVSAFAMPSAIVGWYPPGGMTEVADVASRSRPASDGISLEMNYELRSAVGATGARAATADASGADTGAGAAHLLALKPYVAPPCLPPSNWPAGLAVSCQCDNFSRTSLNPSTIFGSNWLVSSSDGLNNPPYINSGRLRLTERTAENAKAATVPGIFPAAGNYISVEFRHYAYNGSGADGIAVTLSDYSVPPQPGAFGGSLGYAQKSNPGSDCATPGGCPGFAGGWIGVALDEYGNYQAASEGRSGGAGSFPDSVAVRGSGSGMTGYRWLKGTVSLNPAIDNAASASPAPGNLYQVIVDARQNTGASGAAYVAVNRDAGSGYASLLAPFDAFATATALGFTQAPVPANWQISFTGSTGGSVNIHEIGALKICAQTMVPPSGGVLGGFNAIDEAYSRSTVNALQGHLYTKLVGTAFKLDVAALNSSNTDILSTYAIAGNKTVSVQLIDDSAGGSCNASATACAACSKPVVSSQNLTFTAADTGFKTSGDFSVNAAYSRLIARISDGTTTGCSVDAFAVRPTAFSSVTSTASNAALTGLPSFKAGTTPFSLSVTANAAGYVGTPKINAAAMRSTAAGWVVGALAPTVFPAAISSVASASSFIYGEVGNFGFLGYNPTSDLSSPRGIFDDSWTVVDQGAQNDCVAGSYSNTKDASGKYGCLFGLSANSALFGRFVPDHFARVSGAIGQFCSPGTSNFSYMGQPALSVAYVLQALSGSNALLANYDNTTLNYPVGVPTLVAEDQMAANQGCDLASRIGGLVQGSWKNGVFDVFSPSASFSRPAVPVALDAGTPASCAATRASAGGPFWLLDIGVSMSDLDGAIITSPVLDMNPGTSGVCSGSGCTASRIGRTGQVYGRLSMGNTYGSELLPLPIPLTAQIWNPGGFYTVNLSDGCTTFNASSIILNNWSQYLAACETQLSPAGAIVLSNGVAPLRLTSPGGGNGGSVNLSLNVGSVPSGTSCIAATASAATAAARPWFGANPTGRATFGVYKTPLIYRRENF